MVVLPGHMEDNGTKVVVHGQPAELLVLETCLVVVAVGVAHDDRGALYHEGRLIQPGHFQNHRVAEF